jgi:orotate phosphoribosyltransferase
MADPAPEFADLSPEQYRAEVVEELALLLTKSGALQPGKTKSGPYGLDLGRLSLGIYGFEVGRAIAVTIQQQWASSVDTLVAASDRAIPFAVLGAQYYGHLANPNSRWGVWCPGEAGLEMFGRTPTEDNYCVVVGDQLGHSSYQELIDTIIATQATGMKVLGAVVLLDRRDRAKASARGLLSTEVTTQTGVKVTACASMAEIFKKVTPLAPPLPEGD